MSQNQLNVLLIKLIFWYKGIRYYPYHFVTIFYLLEVILSFIFFLSFQRGIERYFRVASRGRVSFYGQVFASARKYNSGNGSRMRSSLKNVYLNSLLNLDFPGILFLDILFILMRIFKHFWLPTYNIPMYIWCSVLSICFKHIFGKTLWLNIIEIEFNPTFKTISLLHR